jgi:nitrous oxide reductase accessory protein NosL
MREYFLRDGFWIDAANPYELEMAVDPEWNRTRLTGYLNAQAFCYHIGATGGMGGGHTHPGDLRYERIWSEKSL